MKTTIRFLLLSLCLPLGGGPAAAAPICRWVDDSGRTHLADVVPERYVARAKCSDSSRYRIDPERARTAAQQAGELRKRAAIGDPAAAASSAASAPPRAASAPAAVPALRPASGVDGSTDCATWRRLYEESSACFGPYRTVGGGVKSEAFEKCRPIPSPDLRCGPARN